ncbi:MAG: RsiG family protein [Acidimicrobiales bacterium]
MAWLETEFERLFVPGYLDDLGDKSLDELRGMRAECTHAETAVSYLRRVAQGRLDIVQGALERLGSGADLSTLVEQLPSIIGGGPPRPSGPGRLPAEMAPDMEVEGLTDELDAVFDVRQIGELPSMGEDQLRAIADRLVELEGLISQQRRSLHERIDAVQAEIVSRYKTGQASPDGLLA